MEENNTQATNQEWSELPLPPDNPIDAGIIVPEEGK